MISADELSAKAGFALTEIMEGSTPKQTIAEILGITLEEVTELLFTIKKMEVDLERSAGPGWGTLTAYAMCMQLGSTAREHRVLP